MSRDPIILAAQIGLISWTIATVVVGFLFHFSGDAARYQPWLVPMCLLTPAGAILVDRLARSRARRG